MRKQIVCTLSFFIPLLSLQAADHKRIALLRYQDRFVLSDGESDKFIRPELISKPLRSMDGSKLKALLQTGNAYVKIGQCTDGEFTMELMPRLHGGGPGGAFAGGVIGHVVGTGATLACGYVILYGAKAVIHVTAGREAAQEFDKHIVQVSIPHLNRVASDIGNTASAVGAVVGAASPLP